MLDQMEQKYGAAFTQDVRDRLEACEAREIQYLEMKQMGEIVFRFRERVRGLVNLYRSWKRDFSGEADKVERVYKAHEGHFLRRQLRDAWSLYVLVNKDYHEMYRIYMDQIRKKTLKPFDYRDYVSTGRAA